MNILYNSAIQLYRFGVGIASHWHHKAHLMVQGQKNTFPILAQTLNSDDRPVWVHAASLGEFEQGRPLIEKIRREFPKKKIVLTFFSPSGYEVRKNYNGADVVCYLPFDTSHNAKLFVDTLNPCLAIFVKYEFWGNYLEMLRRRHIPTAIVSAIFRPEQIFFRSYGGVFRQMLRTFNAGIFVQDTASQEILAQIGVKSTIAGDTRFDRVSDILAAAKDFANIASFTAGHKVLVSGSSWEPDEDIAMDFINTHRDWKVIIAPHEFDGDRLPKLMKKLKRKTVRYSTLQPDETIDADVLIIDCYGILSSCYRYGTVAYIGGGFGVGIHNINEAAVYGMPVLFGPNFHKFKEARDLKGLGGAICVRNAADFTATLDGFAQDGERLSETGQICADYIKRNIGATDKILSAVRGYIK